MHFIETIKYRNESLFYFGLVCMVLADVNAWNKPFKFVLALVSKEYTRLIIIAFVVSAPLAYWLVQQWLQDFEYRVVPSPLIFILAGVGTFLLAAILTSYHAINASLTNPVEVLKNE